MKLIFSIGLLVVGFIAMASLQAEFTPTTNQIITKADLGKKLFFDTILSSDRSISCASCHKPNHAFADTLSISKGVEGRLSFRNTPSIMNMKNRPYFFYDGRASSLEEQAIGPIEHPDEMNLPFKEAVQRIEEDTSYIRLFTQIYQSSPDSTNVLDALASFQLTLESNGSSPADLWLTDRDTTALNPSQLRGREIFIADEFKCFECHFGPDFTSDEFRNIGLFDGQALNDKGRFEITKDSADLGKFKVPGLRNVAITGPYMHNGMFKTLEEVIDFYSNPYDFVDKPINMDTLMLEPINFTEQQKIDLIHFLESLTDADIPYSTRH